MKRLLTILLLLCCCSSFGQRFVEELPNRAALKTRNVNNINKAVITHDYDALGDGGGGLFVLTNSAILVDEVFRIASTFNPAWSYDRVFSGPIDYRWGGAIGDGTPGDNAKILAVFNAAVAKGYAVMVPNLTGGGATNQFQLLLSPTLKANQKYIQIGSSGGLQIVTDNATNWIWTINGVSYTMPTVQGVAGSALMQDGAGNITWQVPPSGGGGGTNFGTNNLRFDANVFVVTALTNVGMKSGALTTNLSLRGAVNVPTLDVPGVNIDVSTGTEFSKSLASSSTMGIINFPDDTTIHFTVTNTVHTLSFTNQITWLSGIIPTLNTNAVNVFHFTKKGGRIFASDPEQLSNSNLAGLATLAGVGVVVKTNSTSFGTFNPLPIVYGGTGTNSFASVSDGNMVFHKLSGNSLDTDDSQFLYSKSAHSLYLGRTIPTGQPQLSVFEGSGTPPLLEFYSDGIRQNNDDFSLDAVSTSNLLFKIAGTTSLKVSTDRSVIAGAGSTVTTRTNEFLYVPVTAGVPTGVPVTEAGHVALDFDSSNNRLYFYNGAWLSLGGVPTPISVPNGGTGRDLSSSFNGAIPSYDAINGTFVTDAAGSNAFLFYFPYDGRLSIWHTPAASTSEYIHLLDTTGTGHSLSIYNNGIVTGDTNLNFTVDQNYTMSFGVGNTAVLTLSTNDSVLIGDGTTSITRTNKFLYIPTFAGIPSGVPVSHTGMVPMAFDTVNTNLYFYSSGGWRTAGGGGGGSIFSNWRAVAGNSTNDFLVGDSFVNQSTATNGFKTGSGLYTASTASLLNSGGAATVINNSASRLSHLDLKGGSGAETYMQFFSSNTVAGSFDTNKYFNAFYGARVAELTATNFLTVPNSSGPSTLVFGQVAADNNAWAAGRGALQTYDGTTATYLVGVQVSDIPSNGQVPTWNTGGTITWSTPSGGVGADSNWTNDVNIVKPLELTNKVWVSDNGTYVLRVDTAVAWPENDDDHMVEINNFQTNVVTISSEGGIMSGRNTRGFWTSIADQGETLVSVRNVTAGVTVKDTVPFNQIYIATTNSPNMGWFDVETRTNAAFVSVGVNTTSSVTLDGGASRVTTTLLTGPSDGVARLHVESAKLPASNPARINNASDYVWSLLFDDTTSQSAGWSFIMPQSYGTTLKARFKTVVKTVQTGTKAIVYRFYVAAMKATEDPTSPTFSSANSVTVTLANNQAANSIVESTVTLTNADSVSAGDLVIIKVDRDAASGSDTAVGDSSIVGAVAIEWLRAQ